MATDRDRDVAHQRLAAMTVEDVISESQASLFEVTDSSGTRAMLVGSNGKPIADGIFGKQAPDFNHIYCRYADNPTVYLASGLYRGELMPGNPSDWIHVHVSTTTSP